MGSKSFRVKYSGRQHAATLRRAAEIAVCARKLLADKIIIEVESMELSDVLGRLEHMSLSFTKCTLRTKELEAKLDESKRAFADEFSGVCDIPIVKSQRREIRQLEAQLEEASLLMTTFSDLRKTGSRADFDDLELRMIQFRARAK